MSNQPTIYIPNGTSPKNIGDSTMLSQLLGLLQEKYPSSSIIVRSFDHTYHKYPQVIFKKRLYQWAVFDSPFIVTKIIRTFGILTGCLVAPFPFLYPLLPKEVREELLEYKNASVVVFAPGGYLRAQKGITQILNLFMQYVPFLIAKRLDKPTITAPLSVGPFGYSWQETITTKVMEGINAITVREKISQKLLAHYRLGSTLSTDIALTFPSISLHKKGDKHILGIVVREWFQSQQKQRDFEKRIAQSLTENVLGTMWKVQPIIQVDAPEYGDKDVTATQRIIALLKSVGVSTLPIARPKTHSQAASIYGTCSLLLTVRLHAALLAITQHVPVIALGYEPKTQAILHALGLSQWVLPITTSSSKITHLLETTIKDLGQQKRIVKQSMKNVQRYILAFEERLDHIYPFEVVSKRIPTVTVALSAYNEEYNIQPFLRSVQKQKEDGFKLKSIVVLSDGSTDATVEKAKSVRGSYPIKVKTYSKRQGKSLRLNQLYSQLATDYLIQSDADVIFSGPYVIRDMVRVLQKNPEVGMCGGNPQPLEAETFIESAVNVTVNMYTRLRSSVRQGNNPFSSDGRLLAFRNAAVKPMTIPSTMIANDRFAYYWMKAYGWEYRFVSSAIVHFRSPQSVKDQIRQNTRFVAAPIRLKHYFSDALIRKEEHIPLVQYLQILGYACFRYPIHIAIIGIINRYCHLQAYLKEKHLTALWDMATSTKQLETHSQFKKSAKKHTAPIVLSDVTI